MPSNRSPSPHNSKTSADTSTIRRPLLTTSSSTIAPANSMAANIVRHFNVKLFTFNGLFHRNCQDGIQPGEPIKHDADDADGGSECNQRTAAFLGGPKIRHGSVVGGDAKELDMLVVKTNDCGDDD